MDLLYLFGVLLRKKWTILSLGLFAAIAAFVLLTFKKDLYESVAQYSTGFTAEKVKLSDGSSAVDIYTLDIKFNNVIETFRSPRVIGHLSYKLLVHDLENPTKAFRTLSKREKNSEAYQALSASTGLKVLRDKIQASELLSPSDPTEKKILDYLKLYRYDYDALKKMLLIRRVERTDYLDIACQSENPLLSAYVVNTLGSDFLDYYKRLNDLRNTESAQKIQQLLRMQQLKVDSLTNELKLSRISQGALDPVEQSKSAMETAKELQVELSAAQGEYNLQSRLYQTYNDRLMLVNAQLATNSGGDALTLFKKRDELREQLSKSAADAELAKQLNQVEAQIRQQSGSGTNRSKLQEEAAELRTKAGESKARMSASLANIGQLEKLIQTSRSVSNISPKTQVEIDAIERQLNIENNELKNLREKLSQAEGLITDDPTSNFRQTLVGEPDILPVPKRKLLTTGLAGVSVLVISALIFLLAEIFNSSVKVPSQFGKTFNLKLKGVLNTINLKKYRFDDLMFEELEGGKFKKEIFYKNSIRKIRYEIDKTGKQIFLVTSTQPKVGKTLVLHSLAFGFLLANKKVLLIDLNFENNELTRMFNIEHFVEDLVPEIEILPTETEAAVDSTLYDGPYLLEEVITKKEVKLFKESATISTPYQNLHILGCRGGNHSPSEVISYSSFSRFLAEMKKRFDVILLESSALNNRSDSYELFQFADRVITVFSARSVPTQSDKKSVESIQNLGEKNFGALLNEVEFHNVSL